MFSFIPLASYTAFYHHVILIVTLITVLNTQTTTFFSINKNSLKTTGFFLLLFIVLYMGTRPISGFYFGDMGTYNRQFLEYANGKLVTTTKDVLFQHYMKFCSGIMSASNFFLLCAFIYTFPLFLVSKKWFKDYWFYAFLMLVGSFSFWAYGTNGIRNGMATSLFLLAISRDKFIFQIAWIYLAINIHKSMYIPLLGYLLVQVHNKPRTYFIFWLACIPASLVAGGTFENLLGGLIGGADERSDYLTKGNINNDKFSSTGFRWDFLIYSGFAVVAGYYYLFKKKMNDVTYNKLFNMYIFANAFWILVIRANFSNRFAYLSWFMMAVIIVYPWAKYKFMDDQYKKFGYVLLAYVGFTYLMNVIVYG